MHTEIEAKWLAIDPNMMRHKLQTIGADLVYPERMMVRSVYDFPDGRLSKQGAWVRVRDEGDKITLSFKQLQERTLHGTKEVTVVVGNYEDTCQLLRSVGLVQKAYQETKRESWQLGNVEIEIDTWPWAPPLIEIEAPNERALRATAKKLGLLMATAQYGSNEIAYTSIYNVSEDDVNSWPEITFGDIPEWLAAKQKGRQ